MSTLADIQRLLGVEPDGVWGPKSSAALMRLVEAQSLPRWTECKASSFADPADVERFRKCKAQGKSDLECFEVGDNGRGCWGDDTTADKPMCALPREDWEGLGRRARGARVVVEANGRRVTCELRDTMPRRKNILNGAGIDLNPAACRALGLRPPVMVEARWRWE
jgi:hypothetical protein